MTRRSRKALLAAAVIAGGSYAAPASAATLPVVFSGTAALANATLRPDTAPAGSNDWSCAPSAAHPRPVVLVHGTVENMTYNWYSLAPLLADEGYCVFAFNYGQLSGVHVGLPGSARTGGVAPVTDSAHELAAFVDRVRDATGSAEVDIVGHSQGGMMPRYYLRFLGGAAKVNHLVALAPSNHGTTVDGILLQHQCATDGSDHLAISFDAIALRDVLNALDPPHATTPGCHPTLPINGG
jgi:triacylglycerol esterase/lipase EstA (alpha/beta hydrolase family)